MTYFLETSPCLRSLRSSVIQPLPLTVGVGETTEYLSGSMSTSLGDNSIPWGMPDRWVPRCVSAGDTLSIHPSLNSCPPGLRVPCANQSPAAPNREGVKRVSSCQDIIMHTRVGDKFLPRGDA